MRCEVVNSLTGYVLEELRFAANRIRSVDQ